MISEIYQFNTEVINVSERSLNPLSHKDGEFEYLVKALNEEVAEFITAYGNQDVVKMADAILDLCYFAIGGLRRMGITEDQARACFLAIHNANMTKKRGAQAKRGGFEDDAVKPTDFVPPDEAIAHILLEI
jgi:predicted HAD superfamily Cof-like phosphohydrolase